MATTAHAADELTGSEPIPADGDTDTEGTPTVDIGDGASRAKPPRPRRWWWWSTSPLAFILITVLVLGALASWLGYGAYRVHQRQEQSAQFVAAGRQAALNLTTIDYAEVDADIKRVLDSSTGTFHDDFQKRSPAFADVVKKAQSKSEGSITAAGLESQAADQGQVLITVSVKTTLTGQPQQEPRSWRMRIGLTKVGDDVEVSDVQFVP